MAGVKKKLRKNYSGSKKIHSSVNNVMGMAVRGGRSAIEKHGLIVDAWFAGKNPWVTIPNPSKEATNKRFIRVRAETYFGNPKEPYELYPSEKKKAKSEGTLAELAA